MLKDVLFSNFNQRKGREMIRARKIIGAGISVLAIAAMVSVSQEQSSKRPDNGNSEKGVLKRLADIQQAAEGLDADKVFSFVLENDKGALVQNGRLMLTRTEALETTKQGFQGLQKVAYKLDPQHITILSPTIALAVGEGTSFATTKDGRTFTTPFAQSVVFVLTNSEWKVLHAHRSFPLAR
jgi:hypothetical protein